MIYITGDTHGGIDIHKLGSNKFLEGNSLTKSDYVIISGDFGFVWTMDNKDLYWLKWFENKKFTTLFVDGNHENFDILNNLPIETWNGGKVHRINDSIFHLLRGQVYEIDGNKFFTFGGAESVDKVFREEGVSWWECEMPSENEYKEGIKNLEKVNWNVDFVVTHTCPSKVLNTINESHCTFKEVNEINEYFDEINKKASFKNWYFGHFHRDIEIENKYICLYNKIMKIV